MFGYNKLASNNDSLIQDSKSSDLTLSCESVQELGESELEVTAGGIDRPRLQFSVVANSRESISGVAIER